MFQRRCRQKSVGVEHCYINEHLFPLLAFHISHPLRSVRIKLMSVLSLTFGPLRVRWSLLADHNMIFSRILLNNMAKRKLPYGSFVGLRKQSICTEGDTYDEEISPTLRERSLSCKSE